MSTESINQKSSSPPWPDWILAIVPDMQATLDIISAARNRLWQIAKEDYRYEVVGNRQLNAVTDQLVAEGVITPKGEERRRFRLPREIEFAQLNRNAASFRVLGALCAAKRMVCVQLIDGAQQCLFHNSLLIGFLCLRSLLEQIAHFDALVSSIEKALENKDPVKRHEAIYTVVIKGAYATRLDWQKLLLLSEGDLTDKTKKIEYKPKETRLDVTADTVLNSLDGLAKQIKGTRAVYEALSEFAHPNRGLILGLTRKMDHHTDAQGVHWLHKALSMEAPVAGVKDEAVLLKQILSVTAGCLEYFETRLIEATEQRQAILTTTQFIIRQILAKRPDLIIAYSLCPCGGGKKTKFCCGTKESKRG